MGGYIKIMISTAYGIIARSSSGNIYKTPDIGASWTRLGEGELSWVGAYSANDSGIILASTSTGLKLSSNSGNSWVSVGGSVFENEGIEDVLVDKDGSLYVSVYSGSVYRSLVPCL